MKTPRESFTGYRYPTGRTSDYYDGQTFVIREYTKAYHPRLTVAGMVSFVIGELAELDLLLDPVAVY